MIGIRVDVNREIATGHIKRDIAIALCLRQMREECLFLSADENCLPYLEEHGFQSVILGSDWRELDGELEKLRTVIKEYKITSLLVDSYMVTEHNMTCLKEMTKVTYFDELYKLGYGCQQLINGVLMPPDYSMASGRALLGPNYISLRQEFTNLPAKSIRPRIERILITSGGTDNYHFCKEFLDFFLEKPQWKNVTVMVAVGGLSVDKENLKQQYGNNGRVELHIDTSRMAELLQDADYVVTAGGTTLYEVCAVGVAASSFAIGDNQVENAKVFHQKDLVSYAGDFRETPMQTLETILAQMEETKTETFRREKASMLQKIVDGKGALRIAEALINIK